MKKYLYIICALMLVLVGCSEEKAPMELVEIHSEALQETVTEIVTESETEALEPVTEESLENEISLENEPPLEEQVVTKEKVTLIMVGDILMHTPVTDSGRMEDGSFRYDHLFANTKEVIEQADVALVNQEVILGGAELGLSGYPSFNAPYEVGDALVNSGFDVVLHATNHTMDKGEKGIRNCLSFWKEKHPEIKVAGINESEQAKENCAVYVEKNGITIAILNYTYGLNGIALPKDAPYIVNLLDKAQIEKDVKRAKENADFVIVCPHWGTEYHHEPDKNQKAMAQFFADIQVDLVLGTHPHVIEPVEWVTGEKGNEMLVYYSLGNFVNATSGTGAGVADRMLGAMAYIAIERDEAGKVVVADYSAFPLVSHVEKGEQKITVYPLEDYTEQMAAQNEIVKQDSNFSREYIIKLWDEIMH